MRWLPPLLFIVAAAWLWRHNANTLDSFIVVPGAALLAGDDNPVAQGEMSVRLLAGLGGVLLCVELVRELRGKSTSD